MTTKKDKPPSKDALMLLDEMKVNNRSIYFRHLTGRAEINRRDITDLLIELVNAGLVVCSYKDIVGSYYKPA